MAFKQEPQKFTATINAITIGTGGNEITLGGENVLPFYTFDAPIENRPKIGVAISDSGYYKGVPGIEAYYAGAETAVDAAKKAAAMPGADFLVISLDGAHPDSGDKSADDCAALVKDIADAVDIPIAVEGCKNIEKDAKVFQAVSEAVQGKNILILSAREDNYKTVAAAAGLACLQNVGAESAVDINLAKQLNVLISQMGVKPTMMAMNLGSAAAGYGFEYVASTIDRVKAAALAQNDTMLQMPIVTPVCSDTWSVKESVATEEDYPEWGSAEVRGINMEITTAAACLAAGSNAVILRHPDSVAAVSALIDALI
jgi:acetyl-CoA decarbonylase/synthase complex subunit delta